MKKIKILLFVVLVSANVFAQEINFSKEQLKYFQLINNAELAICKGSYANAISLYDSAIHMVNKPEYRDLYNLALCNRSIGNNNVADSLFVFLLSKGFNKSCTEQLVDTIKNP